MVTEPDGSSLMATTGRGWLTPGLLAISAIAGIALLLNSTVGPFRSVSGTGVSAAEANRRLWHCPVPKEASEVWFTSGYRGTRVECTLERKEFEEWCRREGWRPTPISEEDPVHLVSQRDDVVAVTRGLHFSSVKGDFGYSGVYDEERKRAYVAFAGG